MEELQRDLGRMEGKLDGAITMLAAYAADAKAKTAEQDVKIESLDARVSRNEKKVYWFSGVFAAAGFMLAKFGHLIGIGGSPSG